jgi:hypothetical protein
MQSSCFSTRHTLLLNHQAAHAHMHAEHTSRQNAKHLLDPTRHLSHQAYHRHYVTALLLHSFFDSRDRQQVGMRFAAAAAAGVTLCTLLLLVLAIMPVSNAACSTTVAAAAVSVLAPAEATAAAVPAAAAGTLIAAGPGFKRRLSLLLDLANECSVQSCDATVAAAGFLAADAVAIAFGAAAAAAAAAGATAAAVPAATAGTLIAAGPGFTRRRLSLLLVLANECSVRC